jgi:hypothetical protein
MDFNDECIAVGQLTITSNFHQAVHAPREMNQGVPIMPRL